MGEGVIGKLRIADCGLRILKKAENKDSTVGAPFQPRHHCFNDFNELTN